MYMYISINMFVAIVRSTFTCEIYQVLLCLLVSGGLVGYLQQRFPEQLTFQSLVEVMTLMLQLKSWLKLDKHGNIPFS